MAKKKPSEERIRKTLDSLENPTTIKVGNKELLPETVIGGGLGIAETGYGIAGLFMDEDLGLKPYESTYETSKVLPALRDKAVQNATTGGDDYAARIRTKNVFAETVQSAVNRSGGSRSFVQSNTAAASDVYNLANLGIDKEMLDRKQTALNIASKIENAVINDKLNKMKDFHYSNEDKYRKLMQEITFDRENRQGAMAMIKGGLSNITQASMNEGQWGKNGTMRNTMTARALLELQRLGIKTDNGEVPEPDIFNKQKAKELGIYNIDPFANLGEPSNV